MGPNEKSLYRESIGAVTKNIHSETRLASDSNFEVLPPAGYSVSDGLLSLSLCLIISQR